jgi:hypothetical protein
MNSLTFVGFFAVLILLSTSKLMLNAVEVQWREI